MKKVLALVMACGIFSFIHAQHVSVGPTVGFGHAWVSGINNSYNVKFKPTFNAGIAVVYSTSEHFGIGADVKVSSKEGVKYERPVGPATVEVNENATYLRVPVKAIYFFNDYGDRIRPKVFAGPSFGYLLGGEINTPTTYNTKDYWKNFDFGLTGGIGLNARIMPGTWLNLDLTYNQGLSNVSKNESSPVLKNRNIGVNVGVAFPLITQ